MRSTRSMPPTLVLNMGLSVSRPPTGPEGHGGSCPAARALSVTLSQTSAPSDLGPARGRASVLDRREPGEAARVAEDHAAALGRDEAGAREGVEAARHDLARRADGGGKLLMRGADLARLGAVEQGAREPAFDALEGYPFQEVQHPLHPLGAGREDEAPEGGRGVRRGAGIGTRAEDGADLGRRHRLARIVLAAEK